MKSMCTENVKNNSTCIELDKLLLPRIVYFYGYLTLKLHTIQGVELYEKNE
jgi:hypothetical protein